MSLYCLLLKASFVCHVGFNNVCLWSNNIRPLLSLCFQKELNDSFSKLHGLNSSASQRKICPTKIISSFFLIATFCSKCTCFYQENCLAGLIPSIVGDGYCDDETNNAACNYDDGDCCELSKGVKVNTYFCSDCTCHFQESCAAGFLLSAVGNGVCNDETNNADCNYDGGDCCWRCIAKDFCTNCTCIGNIMRDEIKNPLVGNGYCNDENNIADCNYDGGDCCGKCIVKDFCTKCTCIGNSTVDEIKNPLVDNGSCNDETNNAECDYDGDDCYYENFMKSLEFGSGDDSLQ